MDALDNLSFLFGALLLVQAALIVLLVVRQRRDAVTDRQHYAEVTHAARLSVVGEITASIVHEVTQPLSAILSNIETAELLLQAPNPKLAVVLDILTDVRQDDLRAYDIVRTLRTMLKKRELAFEHVDVNALVVDAVALVQPDAVRRGVLIETSLGRDMPILLANPVHLQQVLLNLIINAMEAMHETSAADRCVEVRTLMDDATVRIEVVDHGPGLHPAHQQAIFEPFFTTKAEGIGLGLALVRSIIAFHGGTIRAENRDHAGAAFILTLPARGMRSVPHASADDKSRMTFH